MRLTCLLSNDPIVESRWNSHSYGITWNRVIPRGAHPRSILFPFEIYFDGRTSQLKSIWTQWRKVFTSSTAQVCNTTLTAILAHRLLVASASVGDNQHAYNRYVNCSSSLAQFIFSTGSLEMVLRILWKYGMHYDGRTSQLKSTHEFSEERKLHWAFHTSFDQVWVFSLRHNFKSQTSLQVNSGQHLTQLMYLVSKFL